MKQPQFVYLQHLAGEMRHRRPCDAPEPIFVMRPQLMRADGIGRPAHVRQPGDPCDGPAHLVAWLHRVGTETPDLAEVQCPDGQVRTFSAAWVHSAARVTPLRPFPTPAYRRTA